MKNKLKSMVDYVTWVDEVRGGNNGHYDTIIRYKNFLNRKLEIWMFIPCDEDGNVLEEPKSPYSKHLSQEEISHLTTLNEQYQQAKERCLFEGFKFVESHKIGIDNNLDYFVFPYGENRLGLTKKQECFRTWFQLFTVEDLVQCELELYKNTIEELAKPNSYLQLTDKQAEILKL